MSLEAPATLKTGATRLSFKARMLGWMGEGSGDGIYRNGYRSGREVILGN